MIYAFTLRQDLHLIGETNNQVLCKLSRLIDLISQYRCELIKYTRRWDAYIVCLLGWEHRLLDHALPSPPIAWGYHPLVFYFKLFEVGLQNLALLLGYVIVLNADNVLGVDLRIVLIFVGHALPMVIASSPTESPKSMLMQIWSIHENANCKRSSLANSLRWAGR